MHKPIKTILAVLNTIGLVILILFTLFMLRTAQAAPNGQTEVVLSDKNDPGVTHAKTINQCDITANPAGPASRTNTAVWPEMLEP